MSSEVRWIKREPWTEVRVEDGVCHKQYVVPRLLRWRGLWRRSRAQREHDNLRMLEAGGIRVPHALSWSEVRRFGCVQSSTVSTEWLEGTIDARRWLRKGGAEPIAVSRALGAALARLHRAGFVSTTASPRNWLLDAAHPGAREPFLCDCAFVLRRAGSLHATWLACLDLYALALGHSRRLELSRAFRMRMVLAYCHGDRVLARRLIRRVSRWSYRGYKTRKGLVAVRDVLLTRLWRMLARARPIAGAVPEA